MTSATIKKIRNIKPPYPFEAYSHVISQIPKEDGGGFLITFPDLPGCMSEGKTEAEAVAKRALCAHLGMAASMAVAYNLKYSDIESLIV